MRNRGKQPTAFGIMKEGKALHASSSGKIINGLSPQITGDCKIDENGIAAGYGNFKISTIDNQPADLKCFSFMFILLTSEPKIKFGIESQAKDVIQFDFANFLYLIRSELIKPQISFDGIDVSIRMFIEDEKLVFYINDVKLNYSKPMNFQSYSFFIEVQNDATFPTILATPFHHITTLDNNSNNFLAYYPKIFNHFWCFSDKYLYSETDHYIAVARGDTKYATISDEIQKLPGSNLIYYELTINSVESDSKFFFGFTNHEITLPWSSSKAFDSIPYFTFPDNKLSFGSHACYTISEKISQGTVIGFGIKAPVNNENENEKNSKAKKKKINENVFMIINGNEYKFKYALNGSIDDQKKKFNEHKHFYAFVASLCVNFQCFFNFGQNPFKYMDYLISNYNTFLPKGWSIYSPYYPVNWIRGPPPDRHVLNMFCPPNYSKKSFFGITSLQKILNNGCYEITILELVNGVIEGVPLHKKGDEVIAIGFSPLDYQIDQFVGWMRNSYAIHSDDGNVFLNDGTGINFGEHDKIKTGVTVMAKIESNILSFAVNNTLIEPNAIITNELYPSLSFQASPCFIINLGESPFFNNCSNDDNNTNVIIPNNNNNNAVNGKNSNTNPDNKNINKDHGVDSVLNYHLELNKKMQSKNGQLTVDGIVYRVTLFNKLVVMMNTKELIPFNLEVGDIIESRDRRFRGTIAGALNGRLYCYIEKYEGAFPLVETKPIDVALTYRVLHRQNKKCSYPVILYNSLVNIDVSRGNLEDLYPTDGGLSFFIGLTNRREFVFRPLVDFYNNESLLVLSKMPESIVMRKKKPGLLPLNTNSDSQSRFFLSNENFMNYVNEAENEDIYALPNMNSTPKTHSTFKTKNNIKFLDIVKILNDVTNYTADKTSSDMNINTAPLNNIQNWNDFPTENNLFNAYNNNDGENQNRVENENENEEENEEGEVVKNNDWSSVRNIALVVGKKDKDIIAWDGDQLIVVIPTHAKIIQEPFYPFGSHRSFSQLKRVSTGLFQGGVRYPPQYHGSCGDHLFQKSHKGKMYFQSGGGCKMPPFLYYFACSLNEKKKNPIQFRNFEKIDFLTVPFEYYEVDDDNENRNENEKNRLTTERPFNGVCLYTLK